MVENQVLRPWKMSPDVNRDRKLSKIHNNTEWDIRTEWIQALLLSLSAYILLTYNVPRIFALTAIILSLFVSVIVFLIKRLNISNIRYPKEVIAFYSLYFLNCIIVVLFFADIDRPLNNLFASAIFLMDLILLNSSMKLEKILEKFGIICALLSFLSILLYFLNISFVSNENYYAFLMIPYMVYNSSAHFKLKNFVFFIMVIGISLFFEARLTLIMAAAFFTIPLLPKSLIVRICGVCALLAFIAWQIYLARNPDLSINAMLSNRVLIWDYFYDLFERRWAFGYGAIGDAEKFGVAKYMSGFMDRGFADSYGTQSMLMVYLFECGVFLTAGLYAIVVRGVWNGRVWGGALCVVAIGCLLETVRLGSVSIYGVLFAMTLVLALGEKAQRNRTSSEI